MRVPVKQALKLASAVFALLLVFGLAAPYLSADRYGERLRGSLERALGRPVELGGVHFSLFKGPGFTVDSVTIHEDPSIGNEPIAYVRAPGSLEVTPRFWSLLGGRFVIASISLDQASINLAKSGPASALGRWNFASFVNRSIMSSAPAIHVRRSRINFKFGDAKSVVYLTQTDLDITPPSRAETGWRVACAASTARTDRSAQNLGSFTLKGRWYVAPERLDLDFALDRAALGEITALLRGQAGGVHGSLSARLHLAGPLDNVGIAGRLDIEDVHRWDMLPLEGRGWPLDIGGRANLLAQQLELEASPPRNAPLPVWLHFLVTDYLSQPKWAATVNWNQFPVAPIMELARHMGMEFPPGLRLSGTMDGVIGYSGQGSLQGEVAFHDAALQIPDSPPVGFEQARVVFGRGHARLAPALVRTADGEEAHLSADYDMSGETLDLSISAQAMQVASLRAQVALAAVPWLEQATAGAWSGHLEYHREPGRAGWTGAIQLRNATISVPGFAHPLELASANARIDGARVALDRVQARMGAIAFSGEYRYEPAQARPHRFRVRAASVDAAALETELTPTLRRGPGLLARALGRASVPDWLKQRAVDGTLQVDSLALAGSEFENVRARMLWDGARVEFEGLQASLDRAAITGKLSVALRGVRPSYKLEARLKGLSWQGGKLDVEGTLETSGAGAQLLSNLTSQGTFTGAGIDLGADALCRAVSGEYNLEWWQSAPRLRLTSLAVRTDDDSYTGRGATQDDGRLVVLLTSGARELRMSGPVAKVKVEEGAR
jgi:hypothetical protein